MKKKLLAFLLAVLMVVTILPVSVFAAEYVAEVNGEKYTSFSAAVSAAASGATIKLIEGTVDASSTAALSGATEKTLTIEGQGRDKTTVLWGSGQKTASGATLTFKNMRMQVESQSGTAAYTAGIQHITNENYENVTFDMCYRTMAVNSSFKNCTFLNSTTSEYSLWVYYGTCTISGCTFYGATKSHVKLYAEATNPCNLVAESCKFIDPNPLPGTWKGCAIYISNTNNGANSIVYGADISNCESAYGDKIAKDSGKISTITVTETSANVAMIGDTGYETVTAAIKAAKAGDVVTILKAGKDSGYDGYRITEIPSNITIKSAEDAQEEIVLDFTGTGSVCSISNGATFEGLKLLFGSGSPYHGFYSSPELTFNKCSFVGEFWTYATTVNCTDCDFTVTSHYAFYVYGTKLVNLNGCRFHGANIGKAIKVAKDGDPTPVTVIANKCDFESGKANKNAFMLDTRYSQITVIANDCTFDDAFTSTSVESNKYGYGNLICWDEYAGRREGGTGGSKYPGYIAVGQGVTLNQNNKITAGTLSEYVDADKVSALLADGYYVVKNDNGTWTVKLATAMTPSLDDGNINLGFTTTAEAYAEELNYEEDDILNFIICDKNDKVIGESKVDKLDEKTQVKFPVNPAEITKDFTAKLVNTSKDNQEKEIGTVSLADYCHTMIENKNSTPELKTLCESMLDYGCAAQDLFHGSHDKADEADLAPLTTDANVPTETVLTEANFPKLKADMSFFVLENAKVRLYFDTVLSGDLFSISDPNQLGKLGSGKVEANEDNLKYDYVEIEGIKPSDLGKTFIVTLNGTNYNYSALQCVYDIMKACDGDAFNAAAVLYPSLVNYYLAANNYFNA